MENIQIGRVVRVRDPFISENDEELQGKTGIVRMLYDADPTDPDSFDEVLVDWTPETLDEFPEDHFYDAFDQEVSWCSYIFPANVLEQIDAAADENAFLWKKQEIFVRLFLDGLGRDGKTIVKVFETPVDPDKFIPMDCWKEFLEKSLRFPVKCKVCFPYEKDDGPLQEGQHLNLTGINGVDRSLGLLAEVTDGDREFILPLQDITGRESYSKDGKYLDAYGIWLVCNS